MFECVRKIALVCLPVFFAHDGPEQLVLGLLLSALSTMVLVAYMPYRSGNETRLSLIAQVRSRRVLYGSSTAHLHLSVC